MSDSTFEGTGRNESGQNIDAFEAPDLKPEDYAGHTANMLANALSGTKLFGVVEVKAGIGQVHIMGRVPRAKEGIFTDKVVEPILRAIDRNPECNGFVGKQFIIKDDKVKYAWVISYSSNELKDTTHAICRSFEGAAPRMEVTESPLMGPGSPQSGGLGTGRKGASLVSGR